MQDFRLPRRGLLAGALGLVALGAAACSSSSGSSTATPSATTAASAAAFKQYTYADTQTGKSLPYNLFLPAGYSASKSYPLVLYIADSSFVGQDVTAPLSQYGALIWAGAAEQAKHESIVLVPEYPSIIIDDNNGYTTTDYLEMTRRLITSVSAKYSVNPKRIYGTGQSMGCMTVMYLAAQHPDLFAAELFVSGQWRVSELQGLTKAKFFYIAAGGDPKASVGQTDVEKMLTTAGVKYQSATWDATQPQATLDAAATKLLADGDSINFATFKSGTVTQVSSGGSEHMASFEPAYKITPLRDWLFLQTT